MVNKFFSGELPPDSKSVEELNEYEIYHRFMGAYPAYTIEHIETELSWREVKMLLECCGAEPPLLIRIARIENMLEQKFGFKSISTSTINKALSGDDSVNYLKGQGLL